MFLFFDTEFTGLHKDTSLISIGIVSEDGNKFYAEFTDYDKLPVNDWIKNNVIDNLYLRRNGAYEQRIEKENSPEHYKMEVKGNKECVARWLTQWFSKFNSIQFVSDVCHYDFVLLIDIFGTAFDLPENVCASCHDINQDIARHYGISEWEAFDKSREEIVMELCGYEVEGRKHNALYDAEVIKAVYEEIGK